MQRWWLTEEGGEIVIGPLPGMPDPLDAFQLAAGLEGIGDEERLWSLAALTQLRVSVWLAGQAYATGGVICRVRQLLMLSPGVCFPGKAAAAAACAGRTETMACCI